MRRIAGWIVILSVPIVLTMVIVRLLTFPWFPAFEYGRASFPTDPYGFTKEERLRLARATITFLNVPGPTDVLTTLSLSDGTPAYNERELGHMDDVKRVYSGLTVAAVVCLAAGGAAVWYLSDLHGADTAWWDLATGARVTLALLVALGLWMLVGFDRFFTLFHGVFFQPGTWLFYTSDTLIRLFPMQLWQDAGLLVAGGVTLLALVLYFVSRAITRRLETGAA